MKIFRFNCSADTLLGGFILCFLLTLAGVFVYNLNSMAEEATGDFYLTCDGKVLATSNYKYDLERALRTGLIEFENETARFNFSHYRVCAVVRGKP